jgi:hypothetical protein
MAFETVHLLKFVEFEIDTDGVYIFELKTDQPGDAMAVRFVRTFNTETTTTTRRVIRFRLLGTTLGKLLRAKLFSGNGQPGGLGPGAGSVAKIYGGRIWARPVGPTAGPWQWFPLPIRETPEPYSVAELPIRPTAESFAVAELPIRKTSDAFGVAELPIRPTAEEFRRGGLPVPETSLIPRWVTLPLDAIE